MLFINWLVVREAGHLQRPDPLTRYLGCGVGDAVRDVEEHAVHVAVLDELGHSLGDVVQEAHRVPQEVHRAQDLRRLAHQLLQGSSGA